MIRKIACVIEISLEILAALPANIATTTLTTKAPVHRMNTIVMYLRFALCLSDLYGLPDYLT